MEQKAGTTVEEVAVQIFQIERTRQAPEPENAAFEGLFGNSESNPFPGWNPAPHAIRTYQLSDVVLDGLFRGLFNAQGFIRGTGYLVPEDHMATHRIDRAQLMSGPDDGPVIIGCNVASANYFHWLTQSLPAIDASLGRPGLDHRARLAVPVLTSWQEESLVLLGYGGVRRFTIEDGTKQYYFRTAEYSEILRGETAFRLSETLAHTFSRLRTAVDYSPGRGRKLFVARTGASSRRMRNEQALIEAVQARGFEIILPGELTLSEQISLFRNAGIVVGPHGTGLTNIVFCEPDTIVYELLPAHYPNACFANLAHICHLRYWADAFQSKGEGLDHLRDWESDTALAIERIAEIEAIQADLRAKAASRTISAMDFLRGRPGQVPDLWTVEQPPPAPPTPGRLRSLWRTMVERPTT